jgi:hypothetical protein
MQLFSHAHRPVHLGPYPAERLGRTAEAADCRKVSQQGAASGQQAEVTALIFDVCFTPTSDIRLTVRHFRFGPNSEVATPLMGSRRERGEPCAGTFFILRQFVASGHTARSFYNVIATDWQAATAADYGHTFPYDRTRGSAIGSAFGFMAGNAPRR